MLDFTQPIQIAPNIYWVGKHLEGDPFQCHVYLLLNGTESVLIDPGSELTIHATINKIKQICPLEHVKYLVCSHQDPDITAGISTFLEIAGRKNKVIVTHWCTKTLLKHYNWGIPFWLIDEHDWKLELEGGLQLKFIFTPYAHFAGAFCTYKPKEQVLFSSDIFGGFWEKKQLWAKDNGDFRALLSFHEHYMASNQVLTHAVQAISKYPIRIIAPQHGYLIPQNLVQTFLKKLARLKCGLFFIEGGSNIKELLLLNKIFNRINTELLQGHSIKTVLKKNYKLLRSAYNVQNLIVTSIFSEQGDSLLLFNQEGKQQLVEKGKGTSLFHQLNIKALSKKTSFFEEINEPALNLKGKGIIVPIFTQQKYLGFLLFIVANETSVSSHILEYFKNLAVPLSLALEREISLFRLEREKKELYAQVICDPLTGLFNRFYLQKELPKEFKRAKRYNYPISMLFFDIDHFKKINDTYGHVVGDFILSELGSLIKQATREEDIPIRYGGEEFLLILPFASEKNAYVIAQRLLRQVERHKFRVNNMNIKVSISIGLLEWDKKMSIDQAIQEVDKRMYQAKQNGRNQIFPQIE